MPRQPAPSLTRTVLRLWALALALSAVLNAAGQRWPQPLEPDGRWVWGLLLGPPLLVALGLLSRWRLDPAAAGQPPHPDRGESRD